MDDSEHPIVEQACIAMWEHEAQRRHLSPWSVVFKIAACRGNLANRVEVGALPHWANPPEDDIDSTDD